MMRIRRKIRMKRRSFSYFMFEGMLIGGIC